MFSRKSMKVLPALAGAAFAFGMSGQAMALPVDGAPRIAASEAAPLVQDVRYVAKKKQRVVRRSARNVRSMRYVRRGGNAAALAAFGAIAAGIARAAAADRYYDDGYGYGYGGYAPYYGSYDPGYGYGYGYGGGYYGNGNAYVAPRPVYGPRHRYGRYPGQGYQGGGYQGGFYRGNPNPGYPTSAPIVVNPQPGYRGPVGGGGVVAAPNYGGRGAGGGGGVFTAPAGGFGGGAAPLGGATTAPVGVR